MRTLFLLFFSLPLAAADFGVRLILGLGDTSPTRWDGSAKVRNGTLASMEPWRFDGDDAVSGAGDWKLSTHPIRLFGGGAAAQRPIVANGVILWLTSAGESTDISVQQVHQMRPKTLLPHRLLVISRHSIAGRQRTRHRADRHHGRGGRTFQIEDVISGMEPLHDGVRVRFEFDSHDDMLATACFGGIAIHMCTWSGIRCPSTI
jgi:hypothetical protein